MAGGPVRERFPPDVVDPQNSAKLASFRKKVQANRMCKEWSTLAQLVSGVNHGLNRIIESHPRSGWSRGEKNSESVDKLVPESLKIFRSLELKNSQLSEELKEKKSSITRLDQQCSKFKQEIDLLEGRNKKLLDENNSLKKLIAKSPPKLSPGLLNLLKNINPNQYNNPEDDSILIRGIARKNNETFGYQKFFKWELIISCIVPSLVIIKGLDDIDRLLVRKINSIKDPMDPFLISIDKVTLKKIQQKLSLTHALNFD